MNIKIFIGVILLGFFVGGIIVYKQRAASQKNPAIPPPQKVPVQEPTKMISRPLSPSSEVPKTHTPTPPASTPPSPIPEPTPPLEPVSPTVEKPVDRNTPRWVVVYKDDFDDPASVKKYYKYRDGIIDWNEKYKAMLLDAIHSTSKNNEIYAAVHQSLPGDLRVRFKALRRKSAEEINIGMVISIKGALEKENGYFVEWELGTAVIKKNNREKIREDAKTPVTPDRWLNLEVVKVAGHFTMSMEGKVVLDWTDTRPLTEAAHDLFSFYIFDDSTLIDNLTIERNENDPIKPLESDPATDKNILKGIR